MYIMESAPGARSIKELQFFTMHQGAIQAFLKVGQSEFPYSQPIPKTRSIA